MDAHNVDLILKQTSKVPGKVFKAVPFIPDIARAQKKGIDQVLLHYKKTVNEELRYVIKNDSDNLKVLLKACNEYDHLLYREINLDILGCLPDFECIMKTDKIPEAVMVDVEDPEVFRLTREERKRKKQKSPKKVSREVIHDRITRFLNGFDMDPEESLEEEIDGMEETETEETPEETLPTNV